MENEQLNHELSALQHDIWARWMQWMFKQGVFNPDGTWTMPVEKVQRWQRQSTTDYDDLPLNERIEDIKLAGEVIGVIRGGDL